MTGGSGYSCSQIGTWNILKTSANCPLKPTPVFRIGPRQSLTPLKGWKSRRHGPFPQCQRYRGHLAAHQFPFAAALALGAQGCTENPTISIWYASVHIQQNDKHSTELQMVTRSIQLHLCLCRSKHCLSHMVKKNQKELFGKLLWHRDPNCGGWGWRQVFLNLQASTLKWPLSGQLLFGPMLSDSQHLTHAYNEIG